MRCATISSRSNTGSDEPNRLQWPVFLCLCDVLREIVCRINGGKSAEFAQRHDREGSKQATMSLQMVRKVTFVTMQCSKTNNVVEKSTVESILLVKHFPVSIILSALTRLLTFSDAFNIIYIMRTNDKDGRIWRESLTLAVNWLLSTVIQNHPFLQTNQNQMSVSSK